MATIQIELNNLKSIDLKTVCNVLIDDKCFMCKADNNILKSVLFSNVLNLSAKIEEKKVLFIKKEILKISIDNQTYEFILLDKNSLDIIDRIEKFKNSIKENWVKEFNSFIVDQVNKILKEDDDTEKILKLINDKKEQLSKVTFNDFKNFESNKNSFIEQYNADLELINIERNKAKLEKDISDFKLYVENQINSITIKESYSTSVINIIEKHKKEINEEKYDLELSLKGNKKHIDDLISILNDAIDNQIKLNLYIKEQINKICNEDDDTSEILKLINDIKEKLSNIAFDESKDFESNKNSFIEKYKEDIETINVERNKVKLEKDISSFKLYVKDQISLIKVKDSYSESVLNIIEKHKKEINEEEYDSELSLKENKKHIDDLISILNDSIDNQIKLEEIEKNKEEFSKYLSSSLDNFKEINKNVIGTGRSYFVKACDALNKLEYNPEKDLKNNCKEIDKLISKWTNKIEDGIKKDSDEIEKYRTMLDDPKENMELIKSKSKTIYNSFLLNPYFILGLSINSTQSQAMMVRDKVEKYNKLNITKAITSDFDLKNIDKPMRDLSNIQSAISSLKDTSQKFFWFNSSEYSKIWESKLIFEWFKEDKYNLDLMLACYFHLLVKDMKFTMTKEWDTFICTLNDFYKLSNDEISDILVKQNRCNENDKSNDIASVFKSLFVEPLLSCLDYLSLSELKEFLRTIDILDGGDPLLDYYTERLVQKSDKIQIKISNINDKELPDNIQGYDIITNLEIVKLVKQFVFDNYDKTYIFTKRIQDIYMRAVIGCIIALKDNDKEDEALKLAKAIYKESDSDIQKRLRYAFGYEKLGVSEYDLTPVEMHDMGAKYFNGEGVRKNSKTAFSWYKKAADAGFGKSMLVVALCYIQGDGCIKDISMAKIYLLKAAKAGETDALALLKSLGIPHEHYDLGFVFISFGETKFVEVELSYIGYVRVMDDYNYEKYKNGEAYNYYGGRQISNPCRIKIPNSDHWHCVIDNDGDDLGGITAYSCYTRTIRDSYY